MIGTSIREKSFEWTGADGVRRRIVFEPDEAGEFWRVEYEQLGDDWRLVGREPIENLEIDVGSAVSIYRRP